MNKSGILRLITNLGVIVQEKRNEYQVLNIKSYSKSEEKKVEAVLKMPEEMGQRLLSNSGAKVGNCSIEINRTKECRFGEKCPNIKKNCQFYHKRNVTLKKDHTNSHGNEREECWFPDSCSFGNLCRFTHPRSDVDINNRSTRKNC